MKNNYFDNLPAISKNQCFQILSKSINELSLSSDYYKAIFHLAKYPSKETEDILISFIKIDSSEHSITIAKRKAIEILAKFKCFRAIDSIAKCLYSSDPYIIENAAWALAELHSKSYKIHQRIGSLLEDKNQNRRLLIQSLNSMNAVSQISKIKQILSEESLSTGIEGASIAAIYNLSGDKINLNKLREFLSLGNQNDRQCAVQDVIDSGYIGFFKDILTAPVAPSFRIRALNHFYLKSSEFNDLNYIFKIVESLISDNPFELNLIHSYKNEPSITFLVDQLFSTDFSLAYLSLRHLITKNAEDIWPIIYSRWDSINKDYGAIYFTLLLFRHLKGWNKLAIQEVICLAEYALSDKWPAFIKFRPTAILILFQFYSSVNFSRIKEWMNEKITPFWASRYATLMSIESNFNYFLNCSEMKDQFQKESKDSNKFVSEKYNYLRKLIFNQNYYNK